MRRAEVVVGAVSVRGLRLDGNGLSHVWHEPHQAVKLSVAGRAVNGRPYSISATDGGCCIRLLNGGHYLRVPSDASMAFDEPRIERSKIYIMVPISLDRARSSSQ
jgi:hypothetical protein